MKVKNQNKKKIILIVSLMIFFGITSFMFVRNSDNVYADKYDDQIKALQAQNELYTTNISELNKQSATLSNSIAELSSQASYLQNQINISQIKYDKITNQINQTEKDIKNNSDALGNTLADLYIDDNISDIELVASSRNISEYLDKQELRDSIKESLAAKISTIKKLKTQLEYDKIEIEKILNDQKIQKDELSKRQYDQALLLRQTQGKETVYQSLISNNQTKIAEARQLQAIMNSRSQKTGGLMLVDSGLLSDYPWNSSNCPMDGYISTGGADGNGTDGRGYGCRQCVSYVAWRIAKETGRYYSWPGRGDARYFTGNLSGVGYKVGEPKKGSVAVLESGQYGHVAWVEEVSSDKSRVLVSQYNYNYGAGSGMYSKMWLSVDFFDSYVHIVN